MPPSPKSRRASVSAPKGRGAQRAKSGCYTCRIRRKKCDENQDHEHRCTTCVRLKLECLGFGAKRPEWLRDNRNVVALRERIKAFLASQGMIKGHSGSRNAEDEPATLQLHPETESSSGSSPSPGSGSSTTMSSPESRPLSFVEEKTTQAAISASREVPWDGGATGIGGSDPSYGEWTPSLSILFRGLSYSEENERMADGDHPNRIEPWVGPQVLPRGSMSPQPFLDGDLCRPVFHF